MNNFKPAWLLRPEEMAEGGCRRARENPDKMLVLESRGQGPRRGYYVYQRGEYVGIDLPHPNAGGEKGYATREGKTKIHVNED